MHVKTIKHHSTYGMIPGAKWVELFLSTLVSLEPDSKWGRAVRRREHCV
jgi:hypothetical protein